MLPEFGVHPFEARKECTGFIFNRVWAAIKRESLAVVAEGVARPEDVDGMFKVNWGVPAGPFQMMDLVGLDVALDIENHYCDSSRTYQKVAGPIAVLRRCRQARRQDRRGLLHVSDRGDRNGLRNRPGFSRPRSRQANFCCCSEPSATGRSHTFRDTPEIVPVTGRRGLHARARV